MAQPAIGRAAARLDVGIGSPQGRDQGTQCFRDSKSVRSIVIGRRGTRDLRREYAFVYRARLLNKTGSLVGIRLPWNKLYDFAHVLTKAGTLEEIFRQRPHQQQCEYRAKGA